MPAGQPARAATPAKTTSISPSSLAEALQLEAAAATARANEAQELFSEAAGMLDAYQKEQGQAQWSPHMKKAFKAFREDFEAVAQRHFSAYIRGQSRPVAPFMADPFTAATPPVSSPVTQASTPSRGRSASRSKTPLHSPPTTYAKAASCPPPILKPSPTNTAPRTTASRYSTAAKADNRLFVRLPVDHQARLLSSYAILAKLRASLGDKGKNIKGVQTTKTGLALQPLSSTEAIPESLIPDIQRIFGPDIHVEKASNLVSYRISSIPRNLACLDGLNQVVQEPVTAHNLTIALAEAIGVKPAMATLTKASMDNPYSYSTDWIVRFPMDTPTIRRNINILGVYASVRLLTNRVSIIQCDRCFQWHNKRSCARQLRCRLCGSTEHVEANHPSCGPGPHVCPPRCLHCHGPHPADSPECLLRPTSKGTKLTKQQVAQIRQTCAKARLATSSASGCAKESGIQASIHNPNLNPNPTQVALPPSATESTRSSTPPPRVSRGPTEAPSTKKQTRFASPTRMDMDIDDPFDTPIPYSPIPYSPTPVDEL